MTQKTIDPVQFRRQLKDWLNRVATPEEVNAVWVHLIDLREAARDLAGYIEHLPTLDTPTELPSATELLSTINVELYDHMLAHMTELRSSLGQLVSRLAEEVEANATREADG
jgi:hypothetical protein